MKAEVAEVLVLWCFYSVPKFVFSIERIPTIQQRSYIYVHGVVAINQWVLVNYKHNKNENSLTWIWFEKVVLVVDKCCSYGFYAYGCVRPNQEADYTCATGWSCWPLRIDGYVRRNNHSQSTVPSLRLNPIYSVENRISAAITSIY